MSLTATTTEPVVRLHIIPFNEELSKRILPEATRRLSKNISYHKIQTFPERDYGFVDLPKSHAEALRKKLNGTLLKGSKVSIEEARPMSKRKVDLAAIDAEKAERKKARREVRRQQEENVQRGYTLEEDRRVKRGWTDEKHKRKTPRGKDEQPSLLFRTSVPPNARPIEAKKGKDVKNKKSNPSNVTVVEEFSKSKKTFSTGQAGSQASSLVYEDGKGWVNGEGNVVEKAAGRIHNDLPGQRLAAKQPLEHGNAGLKPSVMKQSAGEELTDNHDQSLTADDNANEDAEDISASSSDESEEDSTNESEESSTHESEENSANENADVDLDEDTDNDTDASSTDSTNSSTDEDERSNASSLVIKDNDQVDGEPISATTVSDAPEIHPLEALYKRPNGKLQLAPIETSFSFFSAEQDEDNNPTMAPPQTPHTQQDLEWRTQRSAAPTPDTAAIGGHFGFPFNDAESSDESPIEPAKPAQTEVKIANREESAFRKFFYEKRGESDRAWKKRRREMKKLQRQRENRRVGRRVV